MSLTQCLIVLRARYRIIVAVLCATMLLTFLACLVMPKRYTATTHVVIDLLSQDLIGGTGAALSANSSASYLPTQVQILTSTNVALKVIDHLHLDRDPAWHAAWLHATNGRGNELDWMARELQKQLTVKPSLDSNILAIAYRSPDAARSAAIANAFAAAYLETSVELRDGPARDTAIWLEGRVKEARASLEQAQTRVIDYQKAHGIVTSDDRFDTETERLNMLSQQLVTQQTKNTDTKSKLEAHDADGILRDVADDPTVMKIKGDITELQGRMSVAAASFGKNHPQTIQMRTRLAELNAQLESESARVTAAIQGDAAAGALKEQTLKAAVDAQKVRIIDLRAERAQLEQLIKEREAAEAVYRDFSQKYVQTHLLANSVQTNVSVLAPAFEPTSPSSPRPMLYGGIAFLVGLLLGCAAAFACEIRDRRVRTEDDIASLLGVPVLGGMNRRARHSLMSRLASWSNA